MTVCGDYNSAATDASTCSAQCCHPVYKASACGASPCMPPVSSKQRATSGLTLLAMPYFMLPDTPSYPFPVLTPGVCVPPEAIKHCYQLSPESLAVLRGVSPDMSCGRSISSKEQLVAWRPYQIQVPPPPKMDPAIEAKVVELMNIGYGEIHS